MHSEGILRPAPVCWERAKFCCVFDCQGALSFPAMQLCGDNHNVAMEKTLQNKDALNDKRKAKGR